MTPTGRLHVAHTLPRPDKLRARNSRPRQKKYSKSIKFGGPRKRPGTSELEGPSPRVQHLTNPRTSAKWTESVQRKDHNTNAQTSDKAQKRRQQESPKRTTDLGMEKPSPIKKEPRTSAIDDRVQPRERTEEKRPKNNKGRDALGTYILSHHHRVIVGDGPRLHNLDYIIIVTS